MSIGGFILSAGQIAASNLLTKKTDRSIGGIVAHVTVEEDEHDEVQITDQPVERGSPITDHAYVLPQEVTVHAMWSKSGQSLSLIGQAFDVIGVYQKLLNTMRTLTLIDVITGKRIYRNMLIKSMRQNTTVETENALDLTLVLREVILVGTQVTTLGPAADSAAQKDPASTAPVQNAGNQQLTPGTNFNPQAGP